jgi:hypothetical protein
MFSKRKNPLYDPPPADVQDQWAWSMEHRHGYRLRNPKQKPGGFLKRILSRWTNQAPELGNTNDVFDQMLEGQKRQQKQQNDLPTYQPGETRSR